MREILALLALLVPLSAHAQQASHFWDGSDLLLMLLAAERAKNNPSTASLQDAQFLSLASGYIVGVSDAQSERSVCIPSKGPTMNQTRQVVIKYFRAHPQSMDQPAAALVTQALASVWPCRR